MVGGGGGGSGSGAGAGGLKYTPALAVAVRDYNLTIGEGGIHGHFDAPPGGKGEDSVFDVDGTPIPAEGGGGGAPVTESGRAGGSGSGGGYTGSPPLAGGTGTVGMGHDGGDALHGGSPYPAGGGGGAGEDGHDTISNSIAGAGGDGLDYSGIFGLVGGALGWFSGGGGGGTYSEGGTPGIGGLGGGGDGKSTSGDGNPGIPNTGGGAGGICTAGYPAGGIGGSGIVVIRYLIAVVTASVDLINYYAYSAYNCFVGQFLNHRAQGTTPWKLPDGTLWP